MEILSNIPVKFDYSSGSDMASCYITKINH